MQKIKERRKSIGNWNLKSDSTFENAFFRRGDAICHKPWKFFDSMGNACAGFDFDSQNKKDRLGGNGGRDFRFGFVQRHFEKYFCKAKTVRREYCDQPVDSKAFRVFFSFGTYVGIFCSGVRTIFFGWKENLEGSACVGNFDRIFKDVSLRSLSDRCFGRNHMRNHMRLRLVVVHQEVFSEEARLGSAFDRKSSWKMQFCCAILEWNDRTVTLIKRA